MWKEFKEFAFKGNVLELAVGIMIGGAFNSIVKSLVDDLIMPVIGLVLNGVDIASLSLGVGDATITYGAFISAVLNFLIIAVALFILVRLAKKITRPRAEKEEAAPPPPPTKKCDFCLQDVPEAATRCPYCTSMLLPPAGNDGVPPQTPL